MARHITPLTDREIKTAKIRTGKKLYDGEGLFLFMGNASKLWRFRYKHPATKKEITLSLGKYPAITLQIARKMRAEAQELIYNGIDPLEKRESDRIKKINSLKNTFAIVANDLMKVKKIKGTSEVTIKIYIAMLKNHVLNKLGDVPVDQLTIKEVKPVLDEVIKEGKHKTVKTICALINEVMSSATNKGMIEFNRLSNISKLYPTPKVNHRLILEEAGFKEFLKSLHSEENINLIATSAIKFLCCTMVRLREALKATWGEFDLINNIWTIPAERMKSRREHKVYLSRYAIDILNNLKSLNNGSNFVFFGIKGKNNLSPRVIVNLIDKLGYKNKLMLHGIRGTTSTLLNEYNFNPDVIECNLSHVDGNAIRKIYNRANYINERKNAYQWLGEYVRTAGESNQREG